MAISFVQAANGNFANSDPSTAFGSSVTAGNLLIAFYDGVYHFAETPVISDTLNGTAWTPIFDYSDPNFSAHATAWYRVSAASGADTVTVTGGHSFRGVTIAEFTGVSTADQITSFVYATTNLTSGPVTTATADELFISFGICSGQGWQTGSVTSPMSLLGSDIDPNFGTHSAQMGYQIVSSPQVGYTAQMSNPNSSNANIQLTTFSGGAPPPPPPSNALSSIQAFWMS
jgi:hypothetical protein